MKYFKDQTKLKQVLEWLNEFSDSLLYYQGPGPKGFQVIKQLCLKCNNDDLVIVEKGTNSSDGGFVIFIPYENWDDLNDLRYYVRRKIFGDVLDFSFKTEISFLGFKMSYFLYDISDDSEFDKKELCLNDKLIKDKYLGLDIILEKPL